MKIIEFFGVPYSGKTYFSDKLLSINKTFSNNIIFFRYLQNTGRLPKWIYNFLESENKKKILNVNSKILIYIRNLFLKILVKLYLNYFIDLQKEKNLVLKKAKKKYKKFSIFVEYLISNNDIARRNQLNVWFINEINTFYLAKNFFKKDGLLVCSEGFIQRIHSYFLYNKKISTYELNKYINLCPKVDYLVYVDTDKQIIKKRLIKDKSNKRSMFYYNNLDSITKKILLIKKSFKSKNKIINLKGEKNFQSLTKKILNENFAYNKRTN